MKRQSNPNARNEVTVAAGPTVREKQTQPEIEILNRLASIEAKIDSLVQQPMAPDYYSVAEFAEKAKNKSSFTVREWCRLSASMPKSGRVVVANPLNG